MCRLVLITIAALLIMFGISGWWMLPKVIQTKIESRMQLKIGTKMYDRFTKIPIPLTVKFYLFNVTNAEQVLAGLERPKFQEVGPFMYKQWRRREVVDFEDYNRRIRFREYKTYYSMYPSSSSSSSSSSTIPATNQTSASWGVSLTSHGSNDSDIKTTTTTTTTGAGKQMAATNGPMTHHESGHNGAGQEAQTTGSHDTQQPLHTGNSNSNSNGNGNGRQPATMLDPYNTHVTIVNLPLLTLLTKLAQLPEGSLKRSLAARLTRRLLQDGRDKILTTKPVNQILFDGYKVDFFESLRDLISGTLGFNYESPLPGNKFGFFNGKNGTWNRREVGELTVITGRNESMKDFMQVENWNDLRRLSVWPTNTVAGNRCNEIRGTDGSQFHPGTKRDSVLNIFSAAICTSISVKYKEDTSVRGIPLYRFAPLPDTFAAPKKTEKNACYCTVTDPQAPSGSSAKRAGQSARGPATGAPMTSAPGDDSSSRRMINDSRCYHDGLMDLSLCQRGAPIAASAPHFLNADPNLALAAGARPQKDMHETYLDIEPMTGSVFRAASRAQLNAYVEQAALDVVDSGTIGNMSAMVAPLMWIEEAAEIDEKSSNEFKAQLLNLVQKANRFSLYAVLLGLIIILTVAIQYWYAVCYKVYDSNSPAHHRGKRSQRSIQRTPRPFRRPAHQQLQANLANFATGGARRSNKSACRLTDGLIEAASGPAGAPAPKSDRVSPARKAASRAGAAAVGVATVLGAVSAGPARSAHERRRRLARSKGAPERAFEASDDEELSRRMLVDNEWQRGAATSSSGRSSQGAENCAGQVDDSHTDDSASGQPRGQSANFDDHDPRPGTSSGDY